MPFEEKVTKLSVFHCKVNKALYGYMCCNSVTQDDKLTPFPLILLTVCVLQTLPTVDGTCA